MIKTFKSFFSFNQSFPHFHPLGPISCINELDRDFFIFDFMCQFRRELCIIREDFVSVRKCYIWRKTDRLKKV